MKYSKKELKHQCDNCCCVVRHQTKKEKLERKRERGLKYDSIYSLEKQKNELKAGDKVLYDGILLEVINNNNGEIELREIKNEEIKN